jgi:hypothetical protein
VLGADGTSGPTVPSDQEINGALPLPEKTNPPAYSSEKPMLVGSYLIRSGEFWTNEDCTSLKYLVMATVAILRSCPKTIVGAPSDFTRNELGVISQAGKL